MTLFLVIMRNCITLTMADAMNPAGDFGRSPFSLILFVAATKVNVYEFSPK
jgi:hypothetical protein